jgi:hypothetical protein
MAVQKPNLAPEIEAELRLLGVEGARDLMRASTDALRGTGAGADIKHRACAPSRGAIC